MLKRLLSALALTCVLVLLLTLLHAQEITDVIARPQDVVNLRASTGVEYDQLGQLIVGADYPVMGRSELFPWLLLGDPVTLQPLGWVYEPLVDVRGDLNNVPFVDLLVQPGQAAPVANPVNIAPLNLPQGLAVSPMPDAQQLPTATPNFAVSGTVSNEVNIRYGPGVDYAFLGRAQAGDRFQVTAYHTQLPWVQVAYANAPQGRAWIFNELLDITGNVFSLPAISDVNLNLPTLTPTPSIVSSSQFIGSPTTLSDEFATLGDQLWTTVLQAGFDPATSRFGALFLMDLQTREALVFGSEFAFSGTSINKIGILAGLYSALEQPPGQTLATDIANTMICSENSATNRLLSAIGQGDEFAGAAVVTDLYAALGMDRSFIVYPYQTDPNNPPTPPRPIPFPTTDADQEKANPDLSNQLTVEDMGWLLTSVYDCAYNETGPLLQSPGLAGRFAPRECRQMLHVMSNNTVDALLKTGVPANTRVAHKHGWIADTHGNAAVLFTPGGNYVLVMMLHQPTWLNYQDSLPVIAEVSRQVYNYYNPNAQQPQIRDGFIPETATCNFANTPLVVDLQQPVWDQ